ncbi:MAG: retron system putative HNH endonuclease [Sumerlaeia bacterium]
MKPIRKRRPPEDFAERRGDHPHVEWESRAFKTKVKRSLRHKLVEEQGFICCYCNGRITEATSHVEHLKPRSLFPELDLSYWNLLASCGGSRSEQGLKNAPIHCGPAKGNWYDEEQFVSPLMRDCRRYFRFLASGQIEPAPGLSPEEKSRAATTIEILRLNHPSLVRRRGEALRVLTMMARDVMRGKLTAEELARRASLWTKRDRQGRYAEFTTALVYLWARVIGPRLMAPKAKRERAPAS